MAKLDDIIKDMNKKTKEEVVTFGLPAYTYKKIPFTSPRMNYCTFGGLPIGKLIEFYGEEHGGKTTTALDVMFTPFEGFRVGGGYNFYGRNYAFYSLSGGSLKLGQEMYVADPWEIPSYGCLDLRASYELNIGKQRMTFFCMMNNILDSTYIEKAWNPSNVSSSVKDVDPEGVYMFYGLGRNWNAGIKLNF